jgi:hypothetical protein
VPVPQRHCGNTTAALPAGTKASLPHPGVHASHVCICCRYFVLCGTVLRHYRSERDIAGHPRGVMDVQVSRQAGIPTSASAGQHSSVYTSLSCR